MGAVVLALGASLSWGFADFFGPLEGARPRHAARSLHRAGHRCRRDRPRRRDPRQRAARSGCPARDPRGDLRDARALRLLPWDGRRRDERRRADRGHLCGGAGRGRAGDGRTALDAADRRDRPRARRRRARVAREAGGRQQGRRGRRPRAPRGDRVRRLLRADARRGQCRLLVGVLRLPGDVVHADRRSGRDRASVAARVPRRRWRSSPPSGSATRSGTSSSPRQPATGC